MENKLIEMKGDNELPTGRNMSQGKRGKNRDVTWTL